MAKSRDSSSPDPPVGIEDSDEEQEADGTSEEEVEGSESESDPEPEPPRTQNTQVDKKSTQAAVSKKSEPQTPKIQSADSSSDDEESDSETDSDSPAKIPESNVKPIASKPMNATSKSSRSKSNTAVTSSPIKPTSTTAGTKRPATTSTTRESKKSKKKSEKEVEVSENKVVSNDDPKKLFQRLWSEDDEIVILQGMIDYRAKNKADPVADLNAFLEFIKKSIHIDVSRKQLQHKIRRLKTKYENNLFKERKGKLRANWKPHEQLSYELSQKVWGEESNFLSPKSNGVSVKRSKAKNSSAPGNKVEELEVPVKEDSKLVGEKGLGEIKDSFFALGDQKIESWIRENALKMMKGVKREQMLDKWKKLRTKEVELYAEMLELNLEHAKLLLEAMKSLGD